MLLPLIGNSQRTSTINKYSFGIEIDVGHSFPNFSEDQDRWRGMFYPAGALHVLLVNRLNQNWITDIGVGVTGYALTNRGRADKYVLDFASPHISTGISYNFQKATGKENFVKLTTGVQLGYRGAFIDEFETYKVTIQGKSKLYQFIKPEIGVRRYFRKGMKGSRYKMAYEFGTYFRYNLNTLGTAKIEEPDFAVTLEPRGNIIGGYFKILFPAGRRHIHRKTKPKTGHKSQLPLSL